MVGHLPRKAAPPSGMGSRAQGRCHRRQNSLGSREGAQTSRQGRHTEDTALVALRRAPPRDGQGAATPIRLGMLGRPGSEMREMREMRQKTGKMD